MVFGYALSWLINVVAWGLVLAIIDEGKGYKIERIPELLFLLSVGIPTVLEVIAFTFEQKPFMAIIWPGFAALL
ncbi:hypothetical protein ACFLQ2_04090 [archaeon]